jgi:hypothetical protein
MKSKAKEKKINGKPISYWKEKAEYLVMETLVSEALKFGYGRKSRLQSIIHEIAAEELMRIATTRNKKLVDELLDLRYKGIENLNLILASFLP